MRKNIIYSVPAVLLLVVYINVWHIGPLNTGNKVKAEESGKLSSDIKKVKKNHKEVDKSREFFERFNQPYGKNTPHEVTRRITNEVENAASEQDLMLPVNSWSCIGPFGMDLTYVGGQPGQYYSGRMSDIEVDNGFGLRVASASGGLFNLYNPITESLPSAGIGSFATSPANTSTIIVGTGSVSEPDGTGLYKTTNSGLNWVSVSPAVFGNSAVVYRLRYTPGNSSIAHCVTSAGYFRSTDGGNVWVKLYPVSGDAAITDIAINPVVTNTIYIGRHGDGVYKSTDGGTNFTKLTTGGIPVSDIGRISLSLCTSAPGVIFALMARGNDVNYKGLWRTTDNGVSWVQKGPVTLGSDWQAGLHNTVGVCPTNPNIVLFGTVHLFRTTNDGTSWFEITPNSNGRVHPDNLIIRWGNSGSNVWVGTDGGIHYSNDFGANFTSNINLFPLTQFYNIDVGRTNTSMILGGAQDNGIPATTNGGISWSFTGGGDGGDVAIDPFVSSNWYSTTFGSGNFKHKSTNYGASWTPLDNGFNTGIAGMSFETDGINPVWLYTHNGPNVLRCTPPYTAWTSITPTPFPFDVRNNALETYTGAGGVAVYAPLYSTNTAHKLKYFDGVSWQERSTGLPLTSRDVSAVATHPSNIQKVFSLISGTGLPGQKVYKSVNNGLIWTNITGDLPDVQLTDLVAHPTDDNKLYLGTFNGFFRTTNGGTNWHRWNNGFPGAVNVSEMKYIDSIASRNKFYVVAGTYGRSIWTREVSGDDPITGIANNNIPERFELQQNYPNPFNPLTVINFSLPSSEQIQLKVYDLTGKEVATLVDGLLTGGIHSIKFDGSGLSSGIYFYRITAAGFTDVKKMILVK